MSHRIAAASRHGILAILVFASLFPIYYLIVNSVKDPAQFGADQWLPPASLTWANWSRASDVISGPILNTIIIALVGTTLIIVLAALAAYAFAIIKFPGWKIFYWLTFGLLLVPSFLLLIPLYLQITRLEVIDGGYFAVILPSAAAGQAFSIFVLKAAFEEIPQDMIDSARVDGAGEFRVLLNIVAPLARPVFASVAVIQIVAMWNDYLLPSLVLDAAHRTVSVALVAFTGNPSNDSSADFGPLMAGYLLSAVPLIVLFAFSMRSYIQGLTSGASKL